VEEEGRAAGASGTVGYIDSAIPITRFRFRFDAAYNNNRPDRAEFFYPKGQSGVGGGVGGKGIGVGGGGGKGTGGGGAQGIGGGSKGLSALSPVDYQDIGAYLEWAPAGSFSCFVELPVRFLNPDTDNNTAGLADMNAGFKWAFLNCPDRVAAFQLRTYAPTGDGFRGLGNEHVSLEPALLLYERLSDQLTLEAEFRDWIPIGGSDFQGNVIRYGVGCSYLAYQDWRCYVSPVVELVGWTVLSGSETVPLETNPLAGRTESASGDTIVNVKFGTRLGFGAYSDLYIGYGRALTGEVWYKDILRVEYRWSF
jgi:hypothetical protein